MKSKWLVLFMILLLGTGSLAGCQSAPDYEGKTFHVVVPNGTPVLALAKAIGEETQFIEGATVTYEIVMSTDLLVAKLVNGEADFAVAPTNLAAKLYNDGLPYRLASVEIWGNLYIAGPEPIEDVNVLKGETINMIGRNLSPDILFRYILTEKGLDPDTDVTLNYVTGATELAPLFISGQVNYSMMPEPMLTAVMGKAPGTQIALDLQAAWREVTGLETSYPQAGLMVKEEIAEAYPEVLEAMQATLADNVTYANENPEETGALMEALETGMQAPLVAASMPRNNLEHREASEVQEALMAYYEVLYDFNPASIGGSLPDEGLFQ